MHKLKTILQDIFAVDLRSLALFRILFGVCLMIDVSYRLFFVTDFYSDLGVLPRDILISKFMNIWEHSIFLMSGQSGVIAGLMIITIISAFCLTIGYYTRTAAFICWIMTVSMQTRLGMILHGGDDVFRVLLFWMQFLPLSACYSVDGYINKIKVTEFRHVSFGGAGLIIQLLSVYFFSGIIKWHPVWHTEGSGVYYALSLDQFATPLGAYIVQFYGLTRWMSFLTLFFEIVAPLLFLSPIAFLRRRTLIAFSFIGFHASLILTMELGLFPWLCMSAWTAMLPASFWQKVRLQEMFARLRPIGEFLQKLQITAPVPLLKSTWVLNGISLVFIVLITSWNIFEIDKLRLEKPYTLRMVMSLAEMYQRWNMFAPFPRKDDGWYVIEATKFNGEVFDPFQKDHKLLYEKPKNVSATYKNSMWRKYLTNLWMQNNYNHRLYFGRYLCRNWNMRQATKDTKIKTIYIYFMLEMTPIPESDVEQEASKDLVWRHYCYEKPEGWVD